MIITKSCNEIDLEFNSLLKKTHKNIYELVEVNILNYKISKLILQPKGALKIPKYYAGQYLKVYFSNGAIKSYSIANAPFNNTIELHIQHGINNATLNEILDEIDAAGQLIVAMPFGKAYYYEPTSQPIILVTGGYGFSPLKSILEYVIETNISVPIHLYWLVKKFEDLYLNDYLINLAYNNSQFNYNYILTGAKLFSDYKKILKKISKIILKNFKDLSPCCVYVCGPHKMVFSVFSTLEKYGLKRKNMRSDIFEFYQYL